MSNKIFLLIQIFVFSFCLNCHAASIKQPEFGGQFYPQQEEELSAMIGSFLGKSSPGPVSGDIFALISPHAGYGYSGQTAAFGYKLIKDKPYKTVIILGTSHHKIFNGAALYGQGAFATSLGKINVDEEFTKKIIGKDPEVFTDESAFDKEHSVEVELPFLQKVLADFKIVPVVVGDCSLKTCRKIALLFKEAIGERKDVLVVVSSDLYHGYDFEEADRVDAVTLDLIKKMDYQGLYYALREGRAQACGGIGIVIALDIARELGYRRAEVLNHTNSAMVTGKATKGEWTVGYASCAVFRPPARPLIGQGGNMLNIQQRKKLLKIARQAIEEYLKTGEKLEVSEADPVLNQKMGSFVTLTEHGGLRGCIGNLTANQPLYLTVRDMAIAAAVDDPRFPPVSLTEVKNIQLEISVLSPLERVVSAENIELGKHGVLVRKGAQNGVFLPQVATETGWNKEEFLNNLCSQKAGLPPGAWKDKNTELYVFNAEVFSEKELGE
ncbi:MAG: AmmeMemoRadiSam system protein B [Candidatus Omnitrophica bacterium]|nr:AmmeMemoRadiSam system protein B [Candidatus Omnitrophota bacterium]